MKNIKTFESFISEKREDVGKYNTVKKVVAKLGRRPSEQELATFITNNYYDVTEVERGDDDPSANDKIADLVAFYKFDIDDWEIAWFDAQNESVVMEGTTSVVLSNRILDFLQERGVIKGSDAQKVHKDLTSFLREKGIEESVDMDDLKNAKYRLKDQGVYKHLDIEYKQTRRGENYVQIHYIPISRPQSQNPEWVNVRYGNAKDLKKISKELGMDLKESVVTEGQADVNKSYDKVIELIRKEARRLNDDDAYEFHERLKEFFNKTI